MKPEWRAFLKTLPVPARFVYRDQLSAEYSALVGQALPGVFWEDEAGAGRFVGHGC